MIALICLIGMASESEQPAAKPAHKPAAAKTTPAPKATAEPTDRTAEYTAEAIAISDRMAKRYARLGRIANKGVEAAGDGDISTFCQTVEQLNTLTGESGDDLIRLEDYKDMAPTQYRNVKANQKVVERQLEVVNTSAAGMCS